MIIMPKGSYSIGEERAQDTASYLQFVTQIVPRASGDSGPFENVAQFSQQQNVSQNAERLDLNVMFLETFGICVAALTLICLVICGNLFTIVVFIKTKQYRKNHNCYILSLASADLLRGFLMPVYLFFTLKPDYLASAIECKTFLSLSHFFSDASLLSILLITLDRCWCIFHPFNYRLNQSRTKTAALIAVSWAMAFLIYGPVLLLNDEGGPAHDVSVKLCDTSLSNNGTIFIVLTCVETLVPLCVLIGSNTAIYVALKKRWNIGLRRSVSTSDGSVNRLSGSSRESDSLPRGASPMYSTGRRFSYQHGMLERSMINPYCPQVRDTVNEHSMRETGSDSQLSLASQGIPPSRRISRRVSFDSSGLLRVNWNSCSISTKIINNNNCRPLLRRRDSDTVVKQILTQQDRKAARALVFIVVVFALCWTPHMVLHLIRVFLDINPPHWITVATRWLLMANAGINPFLYATGNVVIQKTLKHWLMPCTDSECKYTDAKRETSDKLSALKQENGVAWTF